MPQGYHRDDYDSEESWNDDAFRLGYDSGEQREDILDAVHNRDNLDAAIELIELRYNQGDYQSLGDIYSDLWDSLDDMDPKDREDFINDLFGYEAA